MKLLPDQGFLKAWGRLGNHDSKIVKDVICKRAKWSPQAFGQKRDGERAIHEFSTKKINEVLVVESTFRAFGLNAWTAEST